jgi:hypothetical protein
VGQHRRLDLRHQGFFQWLDGPPRFVEALIERAGAELDAEPVVQEFLDAPPRLPQPQR